ncbi:lytic murein transglycosylase [Ancylobacter defluvii]|uniref:Transglycosylase n=1 Tax=Ancylobacter defluvii TaxID=1282440 RepID=A0A9W6JYE1_9HYPH|nr:lytic murein transglycosylase [Ancylobacter defluvii]MBS7588993.1 lytic murein transglycosylase [Ancylobacter defluvii]GLK84599.1 transglycosylase [Ancylobacter defluvii]
MRILTRFAVVFLSLSAAIGAPAAARADAAFDRWLAAQWPAAQQMGISRASFEREARGLEPDYSLPDLAIPGKPQKPSGQAEFVQTPAAYLSDKAIGNYAARGRKLAAQYSGELAAIERRFGVPGSILLAIWARETSYGAAKLNHDALRVVATQAYVGRRKDEFRAEFLAALKILDEGHVRRADMKSSWAGAMGLTQFMPTGYLKYGVDLDGDGTANIWTSIPEALAATASLLREEGWQPGRRWAYEIAVPAGFDCTQAEPAVTLPIADWLKRGVKVADGRRIPPAAMKDPASIIMPAGPFGPAFLTPANYFVLKSYNFADLYVLYVGHLADRIEDDRPFARDWQQIALVKTRDLEFMQKVLTREGFYNEKVDGKAGMKTRAALGAYQKANGLALDCWPDAAVLKHMRGG